MDPIKFLGFVLGGFFGVVFFLGGILGGDVLSVLVGALLLLIAGVCYYDAGKDKLI